MTSLFIPRVLCSERDDPEMVHIVEAAYPAEADTLCGLLRVKTTACWTNGGPDMPFPGIVTCPTCLARANPSFFGLSDESARLLAAGFEDVKAGRVMPLDPKFLEQDDDDKEEGSGSC